MNTNNKKKNDQDRSSTPTATNSSTVQSSPRAQQQHGYPQRDAVNTPNAGGAKSGR